MRRLLPGLQSLLLLVLGSGLLLGGALLLGYSSSSATLYYKVVVLKGLLPQLLITLALHPLLRRFRVRRATRAHLQAATTPDAGSLLLECAIMAALAYCAVAPFLLTVDLPGWPALHMIDAEQRIGNFVFMTAAVGILVWWPLWRSRAKSPVEPPEGRSSE